MSERSSAIQGKARGPVSRSFLLLIRGYQKGLSPFFGNNCRYMPTCSQYAYEAIEIHGPLKGSWLGIRRIGRCQPFHDGGLDPVPGSPDASTDPIKGSSL
ncbi:MAG: membrane protein insertion efficiency factor YidD [Acidimicrobiia bacterium]|nr:MAG: membrane protein insertion efficiency factor YidD [Acidimicrobiia bacterium]